MLACLRARGAWRRTHPFALAVVLDPASTSPESLERVASAQLLAGTLSPARYRQIAAELAASTAQPAELQHLRWGSARKDLQHRRVTAR